jgi:hypothetical protein
MKNDIAGEIAIGGGSCAVTDTAARNAVTMRV